MELWNAYTRAKWLREETIKRINRLVPQLRKRNKEFVDALKALSENPTPDQVDAVFSGELGRGNKVQRTFQCDECSKTVPEVIMLCNGNEWDGTILLCSTCIGQMVKLIDG